jgi:hypothetical protein
MQLYSLSVISTFVSNQLNNQTNLLRSCDKNGNWFFYSFIDFYLWYLSIYLSGRMSWFISCTLLLFNALVASDYFTSIRGYICLWYHAINIRKGPRASARFACSPTRRLAISGKIYFRKGAWPACFVCSPSRRLTISGKIYFRKDSRSARFARSCTRRLAVPGPPLLFWCLRKYWETEAESRSLLLKQKNSFDLIVFLRKRL